MCQVVKRDGRVVPFNSTKIENAVLKAFAAADYKEDYVSDEDLQKYIHSDQSEFAKEKARNIAEFILNESEKSDKPLEIEHIQDLVENGLMSTKRKDVARRYITYRHDRTLSRQSTIDKTVIEITKNRNEYWTSENANKNPRLNSTQRDYIAGAVSSDAVQRYLVPKDIVDAHNEGVIHFHDADYAIQPMHNCDLINLDDMLQNGTVISETMIEKPHSFSTACNIATQIIAQVASSQYGGQSISLEHLAPFVDVSRKNLTKDVKSELIENGIEFTDQQVEKIVHKRLKKEIEKGIQIIQYQLVTLMTTNGQAPFITIFMYLNEARDEQTKKDLALLIEETIKQRIQGVKNEDGVYIAPAFPKLIYVLEEDNISEDQPYWYLTKLAAECSSKRLVPDYISEKVMKELKGDVFTCMGVQKCSAHVKLEDRKQKRCVNIL